MIAPEPPGAAQRPWRLLCVDDDPSVHAVTELALRRVRIHGRPVALIQVDSAAAARTVLEGGCPFDLALIDVVMETDGAGVELAVWMREVLGFTGTLLLRSGELGPEVDTARLVAARLDGIVDKTHLTRNDLRRLLERSLEAAPEHR
jgi:CheY-like chemotaxis protein